VLNLTAGGEERAQELLVGGLLVFYQQLRLFLSHAATFRAYEIARPLWLCSQQRKQTAGRKVGTIARGQSRSGQMLQR